MTAPASHGSHLKRTLGLPAVLLFGLAYMAPLIVYGIYGDLAKASHDTAALAYLLALIAITFTALSYGRLDPQSIRSPVPHIPTRAAISTPMWVHDRLGDAARLLFHPDGHLADRGRLSESAFPLVPVWVWIVAFIVLTSAVNIVGIELAARFNIALMAVQLVVIALFIALCWHYALAAAGSGGLALAAPLFKPHVPLSATMSGAAIAAYAYLGFDAVSTLTEETVDPKRNMPRAILWIALIGGAIFVLAAYSMQLAHPGAEFHNSDAAAFEVAKTIGGDVFVTVFLAGLILAQFASGISSQASVGRLLYAMGRDRILPQRVFGYIHPRFQTPAINIALAGARRPDRACAQ